MGTYVKVGRVEDFREGRGVAVPVGDRKVAVFKVGGRLRAIQDSCPHMGASLADGKLTDDGRVVCFWHDWTFDLTTGQGNQRSKQWLCARVYEVKVEDGDVFVRQPDEPPPAGPGPDAGDDDDWVPWDDSFLKRGRKDGD